MLTLALYIILAPVFFYAGLIVLNIFLAVFTAVLESMVSVLDAYNKSCEIKRNNK